MGEGGRIRVLAVVGARPNFMKIAPIMRVMRREFARFDPLLVHTGQHYDERMSGAFFADLGMAAPDVDLGVGSGTHAEQTARVMLAFEPVLRSARAGWGLPDWLLVVGDVNSTLACTLVAVKLGVRVAHVEAGLRSFDRGMPEEINRLLTDRVSDLLLTPSADADRNLLAEGVEAERIVRVGNVMIDSLIEQLPRAAESGILRRLGVEPGGFGVLTLHRPSNVDDPEVLAGLLEVLAEVARELPLIFPAHPRTVARMEASGLVVPEGLRLIEPLGYRDFLQLWRHARLVLTDSGGLQEETTALGVPCLTLRESTERPVTITEGTNRLVGTDPARIWSAVSELPAAGQDGGRRGPPELWDGRAAERIVAAITSRG